MKNQQVRFDLCSAAANVQFKLSGPGGFSTVLSGNTSLVNLPTSGQYAVTVNLSGGQAGVSYSLRMSETPEANLVLQKSAGGNSLTATSAGTLAASGDARLFSVSVDTEMPLLVGINDTSVADHDDLYAKFGSPPSCSDYDYCSSQQATANPQLSIPMAAKGTWYILVYGDYVPHAANYTLTVSASPLLLTKMTPTRHGNGADALITISGAGFRPGTQVTLVAGNKSYAADTVTCDSFSQISATFRAGRVPAGKYTVRVTRADGTAATMPGTFQVSDGGQAKLEADLILPDASVSTNSARFTSSTRTAATWPCPLLCCC